MCVFLLRKMLEKKTHTHRPLGVLLEDFLSRNITVQYCTLERNHAARLFCGRKKPENFIKSKTNELEIRFQSDFNDTRVGFSIEYQVGVPTQKFTSHTTSVLDLRCNGKVVRAYKFIPKISCFNLLGLANPSTIIKTLPENASINAVHV